MGDRRWQDEWKTPAVPIAIIAAAAALIVGLSKGNETKPGAGSGPTDDPKAQMAKHYIDSLEHLLSATSASIHDLSDSIKLHSVMLSSPDPYQRDRAQRAVDDDTEQLEEQKGIEKSLEDKIDEFHRSFK